MYDALSGDYDRFVNWPNRLAYELPFLTQLIGGAPEAGVRVLDAACGTGMHAIALAQRGFAVAGADFSAGMIERARANVQPAGVDVPFVQAGFGELQAAFVNSPLMPFDAVICLGNSLPHVLSAAELQAALEDFAACLKVGGRLVLQNRNFDAVMAQRARWMEPQSYRAADGGAEWLFVRFYDYLPDDLIQFNILTLQRSGQGAWQQSITSTRLAPLRQAGLTEALKKAGFHEIRAYGDMQGAPFDEATSGNLIILAER